MAANIERNGQFFIEKGLNSNQTELTGFLNNYSMNTLAKHQNPSVQKAIAFARKVLADADFANKDLIHASVLSDKTGSGHGFTAIGMQAAALNGSRIDSMMGGVSSANAFNQIKDILGGDAVEVTDALKERITTLAKDLFAKAEALKNEELELAASTKGARKGLGLNKISAAIILAGLATKTFNPLQDIPAVKALASNCNGPATALLKNKVNAYNAKEVATPATPAPRSNATASSNERVLPDQQAPSQGLSRNQRIAAGAGVTAAVAGAAYGAHQAGIWDQLAAWWNSENNEQNSETAEAASTSTDAAETDEV